MDADLVFHAVVNKILTCLASKLIKGNSELITQVIVTAIVDLMRTIQSNNYRDQFPIVPS